MSSPLSLASAACVPRFPRASAATMRTFFSIRFTSKEDSNSSHYTAKKSFDYTYNIQEKQTGITNLLQDIKDSGLKLRDLKTEQSNLEKIFVTLVRENNEN